MSEQSNNIELSPIEKNVLETLNKLAGKIGKPNDIKTERLYLSVIKVCDAFNIMPSMMKVGDGDLVALTMRSLIDKGLVKLLEVDGNPPSFIPSEYWKEKI